MDTIDQRSESAVAGPDGIGPQTIAILLLQGFDFATYWSAVEPFLAANTIAGRELYRWVRFSEDGRPVNAADGYALAVEGKITGDSAFHGLIVCAAQGTHSGERANGWVTAFDDRHLVLAAVCQATPQLAFDITLDLIERHHHGLAAAVDDWRLRLQTAEDTGRQRISLFDRFGVREEPLLKAIAFIVAHAADRPTSAAIAKAAGSSLKNLPAMFTARLGLGLQDLVMEMRLRRAQWLLQMTSMPMEQVVALCGFQRRQALDRAYRQRFAHSPRWERTLCHSRPVSGRGTRNTSTRRSSDPS
ncbi:MAG: helix-turn-helix domain-containing protein [Caulobacteraceae bacterium]